MTGAAERRLLQITIAFAALVPLAAGGAGIIVGPEMLAGVSQPLPPDLESHYRYLSGLLFGIGLVFVSCLPRIERRGPIVRAAGAIVIAGGLARLFSLVSVGQPGAGHMFGLVMELGVVPALLLWQARIARRTAA